MVDLGNYHDSDDSDKICIFPPAGLQGLLMCCGAVRTVSLTRVVVVVLDIDNVSCFLRMFNGTSVRFWMRGPNLESHAVSLGYTIVTLPGDPVAMYAKLGMEVQVMHTECTFWRDLQREQKLLESVNSTVGPSFVLTWDLHDTGDRLEMDDHYLPKGLPVVDATQLVTLDPFDYCTMMQRAMQIHAVDGWFLTLADLLGGTARKFCHAYGAQSNQGNSACHAKYRKRVTIISRD